MKFEVFKEKLTELSNEVREAQRVFEEKMEALKAFMRATVGVADGDPTTIGSVIDMVNKVCDMKAEEKA